MALLNDCCVANLTEARSTIDRLQVELAEAKAALVKCEAANASWQESYCKRHNDSIERLERAEKAESALAQVIGDTARELVCAPDNEAILAAISAHHTATAAANARIGELERRVSGVEELRAGFDAVNEMMEAERERAEAREKVLREALEPLLEHYLNCYDGNEDALAIKARTALAQTQPPAPDGWMPINTAPKSKVVIVGNECGWMEFCYQTDNGEGFLDTWRYAFTNCGEQAPWPTRWRPSPDGQSCEAPAKPVEG